MDKRIGTYSSYNLASSVISRLSGKVIVVKAQKKCEPIDIHRHNSINPYLSS